MSEIHNENIDAWFDEMLPEAKSYEQEKMPEAMQKVELEYDLNNPYYSVEESQEIPHFATDTKMPTLIASLIGVIKKQYPGISRNVITNMVIVKVAQMLTSKRIRYIEHKQAGYPNYYTIILMPSGAGKDRLSNNLDRFVFYPFRSWFKNEVINYKKQYVQQLENAARQKEQNIDDEKLEQKITKYVNEGLKEYRELVLEASDGTREGLYCDAEAFDKAGFGSLTIKISELGHYLKNITQEQKLFFEQLYEVYGGTVCSKTIKGQQRKKNIENLPVNALLYSDPTIFKQYDLEKAFGVILDSGLCRRSLISFMETEEPYEMEQDGAKAYNAEEKYYSDLKRIGMELYKIFDEIEPNTCYELLKDTYNEVFYPYRNKINETAKREENSLIKKELISRELKVLKLSCLYACISHHNDKVISPEDMEMSIATIERLSCDFQKFLNYKPKRADNFDMLFNFFLEHKNEEFTKTDLVNKHYRYSGYSRDKFREKFVNCMECIYEIAKSKGYTLIKKSINNNSGYSYTLADYKPCEEDSSLSQLENLL